MLSNKDYTYHNIHLETTLNYKEDYDLFKWNIPSSRNKHKVITFMLSLYRKCSIIVSANGMINIAIECTYDPYEFHISEGIIEFIGSCGEALTLLKEEANNRLNVVPSIAEWHLTQFDYSKDIPISNINNTTSHHQVTSWSSSLSAIANRRLKVKHMGTIFQIYPKGLPDHGDCLRFEGRYITKEKKNLKDSISDMIGNGIRGYDSDGNDEDNSERDDNKSPFKTAADLLKKSRK